MSLDANKHWRLRRTVGCFFTMHPSQTFTYAQRRVAQGRRAWACERYGGQREEESGSERDRSANQHGNKWIHPNYQTWTTSPCGYVSPPRDTAQGRFSFQLAGTRRPGAAATPPLSRTQHNPNLSRIQYCVVVLGRSLPWPARARSHSEAPRGLCRPPRPHGPVA